MKPDKCLARARNAGQKANGTESFRSRLLNDAYQTVLRLSRVVRMSVADFTNVMSSKQPLGFLNDCASRVSLRRIPLNHVQRMLAERGERLDESVGYIKKALEIDPDNGSYLDSLGWAYFKEGKLDLAEQTLKRVAKYGDGFMPNRRPPGDEVLKIFERLRSMIREAGRNPGDVGLEVWVSPGKGTPDDWRREIAFWKEAGISHVLAHTTFTSALHERIKGKSYDDHLAALTRYREAVKDLL